MFHEDYEVVAGDTLSGIAGRYGYKPAEWKKVWDDPKNAAVVALRKKPEAIKPGDKLEIPIPWYVESTTMAKHARGATFIALRNGELGKQLTWVQTVFQGNQPIGATAPMCVDACPPDDEKPFYWTDAEIAANPSLRKEFRDKPSRNPPTAAMGDTHWRAILSLAVVTNKRVTIWDHRVWGFDMTPANAITTIGPRAANSIEVMVHLILLRNGVGTGPLTFGKDGWTFREAP